MTGSLRISPDLIAAARQTVARNRILRRRLPGWGRLHIDRKQPFMCLYRKPPKTDDMGTDTLLLSQASYLLASGSKSVHASLRRLVKNLMEELTTAFGHSILLEIWSGPEDQDQLDASVSPNASALSPTEPPEIVT